MKPIRLFRGAGLALVSSALLPAAAGSQSGAPGPVTVRTSHGTVALPSKDTVVIPANRYYAAGSLQRRLLGDGYRDLWLTPIKVPVLDLGAFAGGLKATKTGGGAQTKNLRLEAPNGQEWVFRPVHKELLLDLEGMEGTVILDVFADALSHSHPTGPLVAPPFLDAAGIPHPTPRLIIMPDDERLGEFRKEFAGKLGTIEEFPSAPDEGRGFAGAVKILDSEELLPRMTKDPEERVDSRALLKARLIDFLLGDNDRHPGQWKWARFQDGDEALWVPIPRDRDKVFVSHDGALLSLARTVKPNLVTFERKYPNLAAFAGKVMHFDMRLLGDLEKPVWDSVSRELKSSITDSVIDAGLRAMPREYWGIIPELRAKLMARRDALPAMAAAYYSLLAKVPEIHASDAAEHARITRFDDGSVEIRLQAGDGPAYLTRRFWPRETNEIRLYLHGGDDRAVVTGEVPSSIRVRIVGGNGNNTLVDSSRVGGRTSLTRLYDAGHVEGIKYSEGSDTMFRRLPWVRAYGKWAPSPKDFGKKTQPTFGLKRGRGLGFTPQVGMRQTRYHFRTVPYQSRAELQVAYSTGLSGFEVELETDNRFESSQWHILSESQWSQIEVADFRGFGNDTPERTGEFYRVNQEQWLFRPALGFALGPESDISLGPIAKYTRTNNRADRFIAEEQPYGFDRFGQVGMQLDLRFDTRDRPKDESETVISAFGEREWVTRGFATEISASAYPGVWDAQSGFARVSAVGKTYVTLPILTEPVLAFRAGGERVFGDFPYFEAAFLGGSKSLRTVRRQRFAGDAAVHASAELRLPVARFPLVLPWNVGLIGLADVGRVYMDGASPGGWHTGVAGGMWLGVFNPGANVHVLFTNNKERKIRLGLGFDY